ncbi:MAG: anthranilate phosphoribosyltransferase [Thermoplasmataceae archaeon]
MNTEILVKVIQGMDLSHEESTTLVKELTSSSASDATRASVLASLFIKGETYEEISGFSKGIKQFSPLTRIPGLTDIVGTGGDGKNTINVSTAASILCASLGIKIGKHGNRSITGLMGSADFLEKIGYSFSKNQKVAEDDIEAKSFSFVLAPMHNSAFSAFSSVRKKLQFRTIFNLLGPLTNPLDPDKVIIGVSSGIDPMIYANVLRIQGKTGYVVSAKDGTDEISISSPTRIIRVSDAITESELIPEKIAGRQYDPESVSGSSKREIFQKTMDGLAGKDEACSKFIAINAAPAIISNGLANDFGSAFNIAMKAILAGKAMQKLTEIGNFNEVEINGA